MCFIIPVPHRIFFFPLLYRNFLMQGVMCRTFFCAFKCKYLTFNPKKQVVILQACIDRYSGVNYVISF